MKRLIKTLTSRIFIVVLMIAVQLAWVIFLVFDFSAKYSFVNALLHIAAILLAFFIVTRWTNPSFKLPWVFFIMLMPIVGVPVYLIFGRPGLTKRTGVRMDEVNSRFVPYLEQVSQPEKELREADPQMAMQSAYIWHATHNPAYGHTSSKYYRSGEDMFPDMMEAVRGAEHFIFLEYFIWDEGWMFDTLVDALAEKAKEGVLVRMIYDDMGCITTMPSHFYRKLQEKGIHCAAFNPARPFLSIIINNRDHRKIFVVDGKVGFTGGINIADEYVNRKVRFGYWKDTGIRLEGAAVRSFTVMFLETWDFIVGGRSTYENYLPAPETYNEIPTQGVVQPYGDTPLDHENVGENVYLNIINRATRYVYIFTPYLVPDQELTVALCNAAKSGVDVRIVTPGIPDKKMVFMLTRSHYEPLLTAGVRIYEFTPGFLHAKCFVCDDEYATVGSVNLDYRSLYHHFECGTFLYKAPAVMQVYDDMISTFKESKEMALEECMHKLPVGQRMLNALLRLLAPLL